MACLDLHYYVNVHSSVQEKDNKNDHSPITLNNLQPEDELTVCPTKSMDFEGKHHSLSQITNLDAFYIFNIQFLQRNMKAQRETNRYI